MKRLLPIIVLLAATGCSGNVPASGEAIDGEKFSGTFSRRTDGVGGRVALSSDKGAVCEGRWHLDDDHNGRDVYLQRRTDGHRRVVCTAGQRHDEGHARRQALRGHVRGPDAAGCAIALSPAQSVAQRQSIGLTVR